MFKVSISNSIENKLWEAKFESQELAQAWLDQQIGKPHRFPERIVSIDDEYAQEDVLEIIETEQVIGYNAVPRVDEQNQPVLDAEGIQIVDQVPNTAMVQTHVRLSAQFTSEIVDISAQVATEAAQVAARQLLNSTDWMVVRMAETNVPVPQEILDQRAAARLLL